MDLQPSEFHIYDLIVYKAMPKQVIDDLTVVDINKTIIDLSAKYTAENDVKPALIVDLTDDPEVQVLEAGKAILQEGLAVMENVQRGAVVVHDGVLTMMSNIFASTYPRISIKSNMQEAIDYMHKFGMQVDTKIHYYRDGQLVDYSYSLFLQKISSAEL